MRELNVNNNRHISLHDPLVNFSKHFAQHDIRFVEGASQALISHPEIACAGIEILLLGFPSPTLYAREASTMGTIDGACHCIIPWPQLAASH